MNVSLLETIKRVNQPQKTDYINKKNRKSNYRAIVYTRVSGAGQLENTSLDVQEEYCLNFAEKEGYEVVQIFGRTNESARTDDRREFNIMLDFVKNKKNNVQNIIVYNYDRFSRSGINAIKILEELYDNHGVQLLSVKNPIRIENNYQRFLVELQMLLNKLDNNNRSDKTIDGSIRKLQQGYWISHAPVGYEKVKVGKELICKPDKDAPFIKIAFEKRANERLTVPEIANYLFSLGFQISQKKLFKVLRNSFYCGYLRHGYLGDTPVKGVHEPLISEKIYELANTDNPKYQLKEDFEQVPLKGFAFCNTCLKPLTGYERRKNGKEYYYYKCQTKGCCMNKSYKLLNDLFIDKISEFSIKKEIVPHVKEYVLSLFDEVHQTMAASNTAQALALTKYRHDLKELKIRFALGKIDDECYSLGLDDLSCKIKEMEKQMSKTNIELSNFNNRLEYGLETLVNIGTSWENANLSTRKIIQKAVFPEGIFYNAENNSYRTPLINEFVFQTSTISMVLKDIKNEKAPQFVGQSPEVPRTGFEPVSPP